MAVRLYLSEWFFNMGLVGFRRILEYAQECGNTSLSSYDFKIEDNYIEFDIGILEQFHNHYFDYFLDKYDAYTKISEQIDRNIGYIKRYQKIKDEAKFIRDNIVKKNNEKIKKINEELFEKADYIYQEIGKIKNIDQFEELVKLCEKYKEILKVNEIKQKITLNSFKYIFSDGFFGQVSFLNVNKNSKSLEEQKEIMYKDYIKPIVELNNIRKIKSVEELEQYVDINLEDKNLPKNLESLLKDIKKLLKKKKDIDYIKAFIEGDDFDTCSLCGNYKSLGSDYAEGVFVPLAVSSDNSKNMFWNFNTSYPLCDLCKLILFCIPAGTVEVYKSYMSLNIDIKDKQYYSFINMDTTIDDLYKINENFRFKRGYDNPYKEIIFDIVAENAQRSSWQLQNILYVEFNTSYSAKSCKMNYFNVLPWAAKLLANSTAVKIIKSINDDRFKAELLDNILGDKDIKFLVDRRLRESLSDTSSKSIRNSSPYECFSAVKIRFMLNKLKKNELEGGRYKVKDDVKDVKFIYMQGVDIYNFYKSKNAENKISSIVYRLLNAAKAGNKKEFMDTVLRIYMNAEKTVPMKFMNIITEEEIDFDSVAHAFVAGLIRTDNDKSNHDKGEK